MIFFNFKYFAINIISGFGIEISVNSNCHAYYLFSISGIHLER